KPSGSFLSRPSDKQLGVLGRVALLHRCGLFLTDAGQSLLNEAREFFLPRQLDFRVFLGHANRAVTSDFGGLYARPAHFLPPRYVSAPERVWTESREIAALDGRRPL